jgi:hypothetical protein
MTKMKIRFLLQLVCILLLQCIFTSACKPQTTPRQDPNARTKPDAVLDGPISKEEIQKLIAEEQRLSDRAHSKSDTPISVITSAAELQAARKPQHRASYISQLSGLRQGNPGALAALKVALRSEDAQTADRALWDLYPRNVLPPGALDEEVKTLVYALTDKAATRQEACRALETVDPAHAYIKLEQLIQSASLSSDDRKHAIYALGSLKPHDSSIALLLQRFQQFKGKDDDHPKELNAILYALQRMHDSASVAQCKLIDKDIFPYIAGGALESNAEVPWAMRLAQYPDPEMLAFFQARLDRPDYLRACLLGISGIQGKAAQPLVSKHLSSAAHAADAMRAIPRAWHGDEAGALAAFAKAVMAIQTEYEQVKMLQSTMEIGGIRFTQQFLQAIDDPSTKMRLQNAFHLLYEPIGQDHPLQIEATNLFNLGLINAPITLAEMEHERAKARAYSGTSFGSTFIDRASSILWFDAETGSFPNPYDELITEQFVPAAQGKLDGLECYMTWDDDDEENPHEQVWVIFHGKGYQFDPEYIGDWYDLSAVESVMEKVLADAGIQERFVTWDTGDQTARYVFAEPAKARVVIKVLNRP